MPHAVHTYVHAAFISPSPAQRSVPRAVGTDAKETPKLRDMSRDMNARALLSDARPTIVSYRRPQDSSTRALSGVQSAVMIGGARIPSAWGVR